MKLTTTAVRTLKVPPHKSEAIYFDDDLPGFGLRLRERGNEPSSSNTSSGPSSGGWRSATRRLSV
jgi:hypothetical protein